MKASITIFGEPAKIPKGYRRLRRGTSLNDSDFVFDSRQCKWRKRVFLWAELWAGVSRNCEFCIRRNKKTGGTK